MSKKKKKKYNPQKMIEAARRENEIKECGRVYYHFAHPSFTIVRNIIREIKK